MLLSAAIIVKNEEDVIQRCLDCVDLFADEIVVVDTGSIDKTKEIVARHPKVKLFDSDHFGAWTHFSDFHFGIAKNEAIDKCSGKWIIWWDADDFVDEENAAKIRKLAEEHDEACLFSFTVKFGPLSFEHCRMFRSGRNIRFDEGHAVHEYLNTLDNPNYQRHEVVLQHLPGKKHVSSGERNIAIMEKDYYERGMDDPRTLFYLANGYRESGRHEEALKFYRKYLEKSEWGEERFFARYFTAQVLAILERYGKARQEALRSLSEDFRFAEAYCLLGDLAFKEGDLKRAQLWYMMATETPFPKDAKLFVAQALYKEYPMARIKDCHAKLVGHNSFEEAIQKAAQSQASTKVECTKDVREVIGTFLLPEDPDEAIMAGGVLAAIAAKKRKLFEIVVDRPEAKVLVEQNEGLTPADDDSAVSLILPPNLNGRCREEWYGRAAGHVFSDWEPIVEEARKVAAEARRALNAN
jgi:glycosyltransferase involved in cell wall biosynthesis